MSLRWRIALALAGLGIVVAAVAGVGAHLLTSRRLQSSFDDTLATRTLEIGIGPDEDGGPVSGSVDESGCPPDAVLQPADAAQIVQTDGAVRICVPGGPPLTPPVTPPDEGEVTLSTVETDGESFRVAAAPFHEGGTIQIARSRRDTIEVLDALKQGLLVGSIVIGALAGTFGWFLAGRLVRPVQRLRDAARTITTTQDLSTPVPVDGTGELRDLGESLTAMVEALDTSRRQQQRLVTDASHEMRTPLTSLTTNIDLIERFDDLPAGDRPEVLAAVRTDVEELTHLMTELVELATDRSTETPVVEVDLADLADAVATRARRRSGRTIEVSITGTGTVLARAQMIERAIGNLVENAVKYSPPNTPIEIRVDPTSVVVCDHGPGITPADRERVFERFYRADTSRTLPGSGLGLAIVAQIVQRHRGRVWVADAPSGGTEVGLELPAGGDARVR